MGLFLSGYCALYKTCNEPKYLRSALSIADWLMKNKSPGYSGDCWGYNFNWQNRVFYLPANTPTIVGSSFIGHGFLDLFEITSDIKYLEIAVSITEFMRNDLHITKTPNQGMCFSYTTVDQSMVHNANLLGAGFIARTHNFTGKKEFTELAENAASYTIQHQHDDGSWFYAETKIQSWIDSFHTGYILRSLQHLVNATGNAFYQHAIEKGLSFFIDNFISSDGCVKYYHNNRDPIDIHCFAEALTTCATFIHNAKCKEAIPKILHFLENNMLSQKGYYIYRIGKVKKNKTHYMRWSSAWMFCSLALILQKYFQTDIQT